MAFLNDITNSTANNKSTSKSEKIIAPNMKDPPKRSKSFKQDLSKGYGLPKVELDDEYKVNGDFNAKSFANYLSTQPTYYKRKNNKSSASNTSSTSAGGDTVVPPIIPEMLLSPLDVTKKVVQGIGYANSCFICKRTNQSISLTKYGLDDDTIETVAQQGEFIGVKILSLLGGSKTQAGAFFIALMGALAVKNMQVMGEMKQQAAAKKAANKKQKGGNNG